MHALCLVVGDNPDAQLAPFSLHYSVDPYKQFLSDDELRMMAEEYSLQMDDIQELAARLRDWSDDEGGVEDGKVFRWTDENPHGKYDWYEIGGRFRGYLKLNDKTGPPKGVAQAYKKDVFEEPILENPPAAVLCNGNWEECPYASDPDILKQWRKSFATLYRSIPEDCRLTVVDLHS